MVPQLSRSSSQPLELFQTLRDFQCQCLMKDPDTGEAVEGSLVLHEKYNAELDTPLTSVPISLQHVFYPSDTTRYVPNPVVMIPAQMVHSPLSVKLDDKTITYGDPIPELTWTALAGETVATPEAAAAVLRAEGLHHRVFINQADTPEQLALARRLAVLLPCPAVVGSLHGGTYEAYSR